jgi:hypothetical protein
MNISGKSGDFTCNNFRKEVENVLANQTERPVSLT